MAPHDISEREIEERINRFRVENRGKFALTLMLAASTGAVVVLILQAIWRWIP